MVLAVVQDNRRFVSMEESSPAQTAYFKKICCRPPLAWLVLNPFLKGFRWNWGRTNGLGDAFLGRRHRGGAHGAVVSSPRGPEGTPMRNHTWVALFRFVKGEETMNRKGNPAVISVLISLLVLSSSLAIAGSEGTKDSDRSGESCPYQEVENVQGSKIRFLEDSHDFGQIPVNRMVSHNFRFQNIGTAPLSLAPHVTSKVIEGC